MFGWIRENFDLVVELFLVFLRCVFCDDFVLRRIAVEYWLFKYIDSVGGVLLRVGGGGGGVGRNKLRNLGGNKD